MATPLRVLILEDRPADAELMLHELRRAGFEPVWERVETEVDYLARLDPGPDVILADYTLPKFDALHALQVLRGRSLDIPFLVVTGTLGDEAAVECIKQGAADYLLKDRLARLGQAVTHALQQKRLRDDNRRAQERLRLQGAALEAAANAFVITDREGRITWVNPAFTRLTGYTLDEALGQNPRLLKSERQDPAVYRTLWETILAGRVWRGELINRRKDGSTYLEGQTITPVRDEHGEISYFIAVKQDITQRRRVEKELRTVNRALKVLSECNQALVRAAQEHDLLHETCRLIVSIGEYRFAWVGFAQQDEAKTVRPVAQSGYEEGYLDALNITWADVESGRGPTGTAIRTGKPSIVRDILTDPNYAPWREEATRRAFASSIALPLIVEGKVLGTVNIYAGEPDAFDTEEVKLLAELADDLAFGIMALRTRAERKRAEEALVVRTRQLEAVRAVSTEITQELDLSTLLSLIHRRAAELVRAEAGAVYLWDDAAQVLVPRAWHGHGEWMREVRLKLGEGVAGTVAQRREALIVNDFRASPYAIPLFLERTKQTAVLAEPLLYHERLLGVITIDNQGTGRPFTEQDRELLALFAPQAAIAIEIARFFEATQRAARETRSLYEVAQSLTTSLDVTHVLHLIAMKTAELLGTPHAQVVLWDEATQTLRFGAAHGTEAEKARHQEYRLGEGVNGIVAQSREPLIANDYQVFAHRVKHMTEIVADIGVPLLFRGRLLGVLNSHATKPGSVFTEDHLALLTSFANQAAVAIENARLYEQVKRHVEELEQKVEDRTRELAAANRKLQEVSRHKSEFLANMSHELRTPLNSIIGFAELLREQVAGALNEKQLRFLNNIWNSGKHLLQLISDILDISKVEAGMLSLHPEPLPVATTLEDILVIGRGLAHKKTQSIEVEIEPDLPRLQADPVRFKQILFNLLSNAVKFTPEGGTITVRARRVQGIADLRLQIADLKETDPTLQSEIENLKSTIGDFLEIAVTDTGVGIKAEDLPRLFREFVQLETTKAHRHEGTGLGLAVTKKLVEMHGGRIWAESEGEGRGSTFTVLLPVSRPAG